MIDLVLTIFLARFIFFDPVKLVRHKFRGITSGAVNLIGFHCLRLKEGKEYLLLAFLRVSIFASDRHDEIRLKRWKVSVHTTQSIEYWSDMCFAYQPLFLWSILDVAAFMKNQNENCTRRFHENHLYKRVCRGSFSIVEILPTRW